jgi:hypothetical protein
MGVHSEPPPRPYLRADWWNNDPGPARLEDTFDVTKQASELSKELPRDLDVLTNIVMTTSIPIERRAKILEVIIYRGALNDYSYDRMKRPDDFASAIEWNDRAHRDGYAERMRYQEAAARAILESSTGAQLFDQLTKSADQLPQGRSPATEFMNTMLRNGGLYGSDDARQEFEKRLLAFPPETRGRMMYHLEDAARSSDIHLKGERRSTGYSVGIGADGIGELSWGESWDYVADNHWREVGKDLTRAVVADFEKKYPETGQTPAARAAERENRNLEVEALKNGYREAEARDKLPGT